MDSSVLIQAQRVPHSETARDLLDLLASSSVAVTGPVMIEYLRGARSQEDIEFLMDRVMSLPYLETDRQVWLIAARLSNRFMREGYTVSVPDATIAAAAIRHDVPLYTLDNVFNRIPELKLYDPAS
ncbi:MAG: PIN domain-containing protein [Chloroflexota bacterium]|nr:PIN domain-containing protein [Chloroflexota bacterium]MDE2941438.1 PIN domain-containing protein [Chloroflexota bacterium]MDE3267644.1 PIN domain-containing protein [Chloroflexota bacterium]